MPMTFGMPMVMFHLHETSMAKMTGAWLLPVVPAVVAAGSGGLIANVLPMQHAQITLLLSHVLLGLGLSMSFMIFALCYYRLSVYHLPNAEVIVSAYLPLGPCGQGAYALLQLAQAGQAVFSSTDFAGQAVARQVILIMSTVAALMLWGLGLWWLAHGSICVLLRLRSDSLKPNMGFWGFISSLASLVIAHGPHATMLITCKV